MSTFKRLEDEDVQIIFDCLHSAEGRKPPPHLKFKIVQPGTNGLRLSPPSYEFDDGLYVLLRPMKKSKSTSKKKKKTVQPQQSDVAVNQTPPHLRDYIMHDLPPESCPWSLSGPQFPGGGAIAAAATTVVNGNTFIQQRYCYPKGRPEYSSQKGGALWTMFNIVSGKEDHQYRLLHVYLSPKRAANKGVPLSKEAIAAAIAASPMSSTSTVNGKKKKKKQKKKYIPKNKNNSNKRGPQRQLPLAKNKKARLPTNPPPLPRTFQPQPRGQNIFLQHPYHHNYHHYQQQPQMAAFPSTPPLPPPLPPLPPMLMSPHRSNTNGSPIPGAIVDNNNNNNSNDNDNTGLVHIRSLCGSPLSFDMHQPPFTSSPYYNNNIDGSASSFSHNTTTTTTANFVTPHRQYNHHHRPPGGPRATTATTAVQAGKKNNKSSSNHPFRSRFSATPPHGIHQSPGLQGITKKKTTSTGVHDGHHPPPMMSGPVLSCEMDAPESPLLPSFHDVVDATGSVWNDPFMGTLPGAGGSDSSSTSSLQMMGPLPSGAKGGSGTAKTDHTATTASLSPAANTTTTTATNDDMSVVAEISKKGWADRLEALHDSLRKTILNAPEYQQGELVGVLACWARSIAKDPLQGMVPPVVAVTPTATKTAGPTPEQQRRGGVEKHGSHKTTSSAVAASTGSGGGGGGGNETANINSLTANTTSLTLSSSPPSSSAPTAAAAAAVHGCKENEGHHKIKTSTAATATAAV